MAAPGSSSDTSMPTAASGPVDAPQLAVAEPPSGGPGDAGAAAAATTAACAGPTTTSRTAAPELPRHDPSPEAGETFLLMQPRWWDLLLSCEKKLEIRPSKLRPGRWFVGHKGEIMGYVIISDAWTIDTDEQWSAHREQHCVGLEERPYAGTRQKCWANRVTRAVRLQCPVPYRMKRGPVGFCKFEPAELSDEVAAGLAQPGHPTLRKRPARSPASEAAAGDASGTGLRADPRGERGD